MILVKSSRYAKKEVLLGTVGVLTLLYQVMNLNGPCFPTTDVFAILWSRVVVCCISFGVTVHFMTALVSPVHMYFMLLVKCL